MPREDLLDPNTSRRLAELVDISLAELDLETVLAALLVGRAQANAPSTGVALPSTGAVLNAGKLPPAKPQATTATPVLSLPIRPQTLNELMAAANLTGQIVKGIATETLVVDAGQSTSLSLSGDPAQVFVYVQPIKVRSTYYDPTITAQVTVDGKPVILPGTVFSVQGPAEVSLGQFYYVRNSITITITNGSDTDILIFGETEYLAITTSYFNEVFQPLLARGMDDLQAAALAQYQGGGG